jgi:hypothetical protein
MIYSLFGATVIPFSPVIIRDKDISFSYLASIEALSVVLSIFMLNPARAVDRFFAVLSTFVKSLP